LCFPDNEQEPSPANDLDEMQTSIGFYHPYIAAHMTTEYLSNEQDQVYADALDVSFMEPTSL
jgi:hypothetical protein